MRCNGWKSSVAMLLASLVGQEVRAQSFPATAAPYAAASNGVAPSAGPTFPGATGQSIPTPFVTSAQGGYTAPAAPSTVAPPYGGATLGSPSFTPSSPAATSPAVVAGSPYGTPSSLYAPVPANGFGGAVGAYRAPAAAPTFQGPTSFPGTSAAATYGSAPVRQFNNAPLLASSTQPAVPSLSPAPSSPTFQTGPYDAPPPGAPGSGPLGTTTGYAGYGASYAASGAAPSPYSNAGACATCGPCGPCYNWYDYLTIFSTIDAFKGPLDLDGLNGNFGKRVGVNLTLPIYAPWGLAAQVGSSAGWYDYKGTLFTGSGDRFQNFSTVGVFQRSPIGLNWGAVYDFMIDDYYSNFRFEQIRGAVSYNWNPWNELGVWMSIPQKKDSAVIGAPPVNNTFEPLMQGAVYWQHAWSDGAWTRAHVGLAEQPGDVVWGSSSQVAITNFAALTGGFHYVLPSAGGTTGRQEEMWNVSVGVTFFPGSAMRAATSPLAPLLPMADNGNFGVWRHQ